MRNKPILLGILFILIAVSCTEPKYISSNDCEELSEAILDAKIHVNQELRGNIPNDFDAAKFLAITHKKDPRAYNTLQRYRLEIRPLQAHYAILVYRISDNTLQAFDFSCTKKVSGKLCDTTKHFDASDIYQYDECVSETQ